MHRVSVQFAREATSFPFEPRKGRMETMAWETERRGGEFLVLELNLSFSSEKTGDFFFVFAPTKIHHVRL